MTLEWSISDTKKGARTTAEISEKSKLSRRSKLRYNCCHEPIFSFIPLDRVIIDTLHLFLRGADVLINLLIRDLQILDGLEKAGKTLPDREKHHNMRNYEEF